MRSLLEHFGETFYSCRGCAVGDGIQNSRGKRSSPEIEIRKYERAPPSDLSTRSTSERRTEGKGAGPKTNLPNFPSS